LTRQPGDKSTPLTCIDFVILLHNFKSMKLFHRNCPPEFDNMAAAIDRCTQSRDPIVRILAENLMLDYRVSKYCANKFLDLFTKRYDASTASEPEKSSQSIISALKDYKDLGSRRPIDTFLNGGNQENFVPQKDRPTHVRNTWNLSRFLTLRSIGQKELRTLPWPDADDAPVTIPGIKAATKALSTLFSSDPHSSMEKLLLLRNSLPPYHPIWAANAEQARLVQSHSDPASWYFPLGMDTQQDGKNQPEPIFLAVLEYEVPEATPLVCPTQLDAGANHLHFPTPPWVLRETGGRTLRLDTPTSIAPWLPEFIHQQIDFHFQSWLSAKRLQGSLVATPRAADPSLFRSAQCSHYRQECGVETDDWGIFLI